MNTLCHPHPSHPRFRVDLLFASQSAEISMQRGLSVGLKFPTTQRSAEVVAGSASRAVFVLTVPVVEP
jgi:hypothetical protein